MALIPLAIPSLRRSDVISHIQKPKTLPKRDLPYSIVSEEVAPFVEVDDARFRGIRVRWRTVFAEVVQRANELQNHSVHDRVRLYNVLLGKGRGDEFALAAVIHPVSGVDDAVFVDFVKVLAREGLVEFVLQHAQAKGVYIGDGPGVGE